MGEVFKPEDVLKKERHVSDLASKPIPRLTDLESILQEIAVIKREINKIKVALKTHGITYE